MLCCISNNFRGEKINMNTVYAIFSGYADDEQLHSIYKTKELAEKALKILNIQHEVVLAYIKEYAVQDTLPKVPNTFILYGNQDGDIYYSFELIDKIDDNIFNQYPLVIYPLHIGNYQVARRFTKDHLLDAENILKKQIKEIMPAFIKTFEELVPKMRIILDPHFVMIGKDQLHQQLNIRLFSISCSDKHWDDDYLIYIAFGFLLERFEYKVQNYYSNIIDKFLLRIQDSFIPEQIKYEIANMIDYEQPSWMLRDHNDFTKCFYNFWTGRDRFSD